MDIKTIFKPTWKLVLITIVIGLILTVLGIFLTVFGIHGPAILTYAGIALVIPLWLLAQAQSGIFYSVSIGSIIISVVLQLAYYYFIISLLSYFIQKKFASKSS